MKNVKYFFVLALVLLGTTGVRVFATEVVPFSVDSIEVKPKIVLTSITIKSPEAKSYVKGEFKIVANVSPKITTPKITSKVEFFEQYIGKEDGKEISIGIGNCEGEVCYISWNTTLKSESGPVLDGLHQIWAKTSDGMNKSDRVDVIVDNTAPVITISDYIKTPTKQDITVTATTNEGTLNFASKTFTANGSFDFVVTDEAGNVTTQTVTISNIDKTVHRSGGSTGGYLRTAVAPIQAVAPTPNPEGQVLGAEKFVFTLLLKKGSKGDEVMELQKFLNAAGYDCGTPDGKFGPKTKAAVIKFQLANGITPATGTVGPKTRAILNK